jgi:hypothetical protein
MRAPFAPPILGSFHLCRDDDSEPVQEPQPHQRKKKTETQGVYDPHSRYQVIGLGAVTAEQARQLSDERRSEAGRVESRRNQQENEAAFDRERRAFRVRMRLWGAAFI